MYTAVKGGQWMKVMRTGEGFQLLAPRKIGLPLCGKCTPSAFGISPYRKATHYDLRVAGAPTNRVRCHPTGGDKS